MKIPFFTCALSLQSDKSIEEVGEILSKVLFGGLPFGGKDEFIRDEIPAIYINEDIIGLNVVLYGYGGENGFILEAYPSFKLEGLEPGEYDEFKLDRYFTSLLSNVKGIKVDFEKVHITKHPLSII